MKSWLKKVGSIFSFTRKKSVATLLNKTEENTDELQVPWWGTFSVDEQQSRYFKVGNIVICLDRFNQQWHITTHREGEEPFKSFAAQATNEITLKPAMPDRSLLSKLDRPFYIPMGEKLLLYISSPLWIQIEAGKPAVLLDEIPTEALADTWFGKNTLDGELCYASQIHCSTDLEELPRDTTRIISLVSIENRSRETLLLQELRVPLPFLSIYGDKQNYLWTEQLNIFHEDLNNVEISVIKGSPKPMDQIQFVYPARLSLKPGLKSLFTSSLWK